MEIAFTAAFVSLALIAAGTDIARMTIPNWVSLAFIGLYPIAALACGERLGVIGGHFIFAGVILAVCFGMFALNILGGGDAKVIPAVALWTGASAFFPFLLGMTLAGGALALFLLGARSVFAPAEGQPDFVNRLLSKQRGAPYAVAIAVGVVMAAPHLHLGS